MLSPTRRHLPLSTKSIITHPSLNLTLRRTPLKLPTPTPTRFLTTITPPTTMSAPPAHSDTTHFTDNASAPGENFEARQTSTSEDYKPDPSKSLPLNKARQALVDDVIALYSCQPTVERVKRYTPDCVYDDQFVYANDRYKMAGQWFALPKLFKKSVCEGYQVVKNDRDLIQFKNEQVCPPPPGLPFPGPSHPFSIFSSTIYRY